MIQPSQRAARPGWGLASSIHTGTLENALQDRAAAWQPLACDLALWSELTGNGDHASVLANELRKAIEWLPATGKEVRNARLAPFARTSAEVWETLQQESNVELRPITLAGAGPQRKVTLDVTIDGCLGRRCR